MIIDTKNNVSSRKSFMKRALNFSKLSEEAVIMGYFKLILGVWSPTYRVIRPGGGCNPQCKKGLYKALKLNTKPMGVDS